VALRSCAAGRSPQALRLLHPQDPAPLLPARSKAPGRAESLRPGTTPPTSPTVVYRQAGPQGPFAPQAPALTRGFLSGFVLTASVCPVAASPSPFSRFLQSGFCPDAHSLRTSLVLPGRNTTSGAFFFLTPLRHHLSSHRLKAAFYLFLGHVLCLPVSA
jgi:hypothetical protein